MRGHSAGTIHQRGPVEGKTFYVEVWRQSLLRWLVSQAYHRWEKWTEPLMRPLSGWHRRHFGKGLDYIPLVNRRDIRCYHLQQKRRISLAIYVTEDQYNAITGLRRSEHGN